jgi:hypothetical protein
MNEEEKLYQIAVMTKNGESYEKILEEIKKLFGSIEPKVVRRVAKYLNQKLLGENNEY